MNYCQPFHKLLKMESAFLENSGHSVLLFLMPRGWEQKYIWANENITNGRDRASISRIQLLKNEWVEREGWWMCAEHTKAFLLRVVFCVCSAWFLLLQVAESPPRHLCVLVCSANSTCTACAFLSAVTTKLVSSVPAEWRAFTSTEMQLESRPEVGTKGLAALYPMESTGRKGGRGSQWPSLYSFLYDSVPSTRGRSRPYSASFQLVLWDLLSV